MCSRHASRRFAVRTPATKNATQMPPEYARQRHGPEAGVTFGAARVKSPSANCWVQMSTSGNASVVLRSSGTAGRPEVLLFDEPVNGLDPEGVRWVRRLMNSQAFDGPTVDAASHLRPEMEQTAQDLVVIGRGRSSARARWPASSTVPARAAPACAHPAMPRRCSRPRKNSPVRLFATDRRPKEWVGELPVGLAVDVRGAGRGVSRPRISRIVVDLPAPFGPRAGDRPVGLRHAGTLLSRARTETERSGSPPELATRIYLFPPFSRFRPPPPPPERPCGGSCQASRFFATPIAMARSTIAMPAK